MCRILTNKLNHIRELRHIDDSSFYSGLNYETNALNQAVIRF